MFSFPAHFLIGAALSYFFGFSLLWGAIGGMLPDLDYFTPWHRGPFHSIIMAPIMATVIYVFTRSRHKSIGLGIGFAAHSLADWLNFEGVMLLWPFSSEILRLNIVTWDNPIANGLLSLMSVLLILSLKKYRKKKAWPEILHSFLPPRFRQSKKQKNKKISVK